MSETSRPPSVRFADTSPASRGRKADAALLFPPPLAGEVSAKRTEGGPQDFSRAQIVAAARAWLATPYVHQASAKGEGADCLGLVIGVYTELYGRAPETPPPYTPDWNERRPCEEPLLSAARRHLVEASFAPLGKGAPSFAPLGKGGWGDWRDAGKPSNEGDAGAGGANPHPTLPLPAGGKERNALPLRGGGKAFLPGQVLIFRVVTTGPAKHCGIVSAPDRFIHAYAGRAVVESWLSRWWTLRVAGVFEFPGVL